MSDKATCPACKRGFPPQWPAEKVAEAMRAVEVPGRTTLENVVRERDEARAELEQWRMTFRPFIDSGERMIENGREFTRCLCGWYAPVGSTRCGNQAHWGNVQKAWEQRLALAAAELEKAREALRTIGREIGFDCPAHQFVGFQLDCDACIAKSHPILGVARAILAAPPSPSTTPGTTEPTKCECGLILAFCTVHGPTKGINHG